MSKSMFLAENAMWGDKALFTTRDSAIRYVLKTYIVNGLGGWNNYLMKAITQGNEEDAQHALEEIQNDLTSLAEDGYIEDFAFIYNVDVIESE